MPFVELLADAAVSEALVRMRAPAIPVERLRQTLELLAEAMGRLPMLPDGAQRAANACRGALFGALEVMRRLPPPGANPQATVDFLAWFVDRVGHMRPGHCIFLPGGWLVPEKYPPPQGQNEASVHTPAPLSREISSFPTRKGD